MKIPPVGPGGHTEGSKETGKTPPSKAQISTDDPWYTYAHKMFPGTAITKEIIDGLKKNMMTMINTTMSHINKRHAEAQQYIKRVARGQE